MTAEPPSPTRRLFIAINLPTEVREQICEATRPLRDADADGVASWVRHERLHITVKFLGDVTAGASDTVAAGLEAAAATVRAFDIELATVGAFPTLRRPRVLWLGVSGPPLLELVHHDVEVLCERAGFPLEGRPFRPHLTLARVRRPMTRESAAALAKAAKQVSFNARVLVESIDLMESRAGGGSAYAKIASAPLRSV